MLDKHIPVQVPATVAVCPICGAAIHVVDCDEVSYDGNDKEVPEHITVDCETEPKRIGSYEWRDWHNGHYRTPYADWLPVDLIVLEWFKGVVANA